jgi:hypothetical protein
LLQVLVWELLQVLFLVQSRVLLQAPPQGVEPQAQEEVVLPLVQELPSVVLAQSLAFLQAPAQLEP